jgi:hypothetical protein
MAASSGGNAVDRLVRIRDIGTGPDRTATYHDVALADGLRALSRTGNRDRSLDYGSNGKQ